MLNMSAARAAAKLDPPNLHEPDDNPNLFHGLQRSPNGPIDARTYRTQDSVFDSPTRADPQDRFDFEPLVRKDEQPPEKWWRTDGFLNAAEECQLIERWQTSRDVEARNKVVSAHLPLCAKRAGKYYPLVQHLDDGTLFDECVAVASSALYRACDTFDPTRGYRLATFAWKSVNGAIYAFVNDVRSPSGNGRKRPVQTTCGKCGGPLGKVTGIDVCQSCGHTARAWPSDVPLDKERPGGFDETFALRDLINEDWLPPEVQSPSADEDVDFEIEGYRHIIKSGVSNLSERERFVISERFAKNNPRSTEEVASKLGISTERVRQIGNTALLKIKDHALEAKRKRFAPSMMRHAFDRYYRRVEGLDPDVYGHLRNERPSAYAFDWWRKHVQPFDPKPTSQRRSAPEPSVQKAGVPPGEWSKRVEDAAIAMRARMAQQRAARAAALVVVFEPKPKQKKCNRAKAA